MRKKTLISMAAVATLSFVLFAGCGEVQKSDVIPTDEPAHVTATGVPTSNPEPTPSPTPTPTSTPTPTPTLSPTPAYTYTDMQKDMYVEKLVNVRSLPSTSGKKLGTLEVDEKVAVTGKCNEVNWYRILYKGEIAYVSTSYLTEQSPYTLQSYWSSGSWLSIGRYQGMQIVVRYIESCNGVFLGTPESRGIPTAGNGIWQDE